MGERPRAHAWHGLTMRRRPRFTYTTLGLIAIDLTLALPVARWHYTEPTVGGTARAGSGVLAGYAVRRDAGLALTLRFMEEEWPEVERLIVHLQEGVAVTWYANDDDPTGVAIRLESPAPGGSFDAIPDPTYPRALHLPVVFRRADGAAWELEYFAEAV